MATHILTHASCDLAISEALLIDILRQHKCSTMVVHNISDMKTLRGFDGMVAVVNSVYFSRGLTVQFVRWLSVCLGKQKTNKTHFRKFIWMSIYDWCYIHVHTVWEFFSVYRMSYQVLYSLQKSTKKNVYKELKNMKFIVTKCLQKKLNTRRWYHLTKALL